MRKLLLGLLLISASPVWAMTSYGVEALTLMIKAGRDVKASAEYLEQINNPYQVKAIELFLNHQCDGAVYEIANKFPALLQFRNQYSIAALQIMVEDGRHVLEVMDSLVQVDNSYQVEAIRSLVSGRKQGGDKYSVKDSFPLLFRFQNSYSVAALKAMIDHGRSLDSLSYLVQVDSDLQVAAISLLLSHHLKDNDDYEIKNKFPTLLLIDNIWALRALEAVVNAGLRVTENLTYLIRVTAEAELNTVKLLVQANDDAQFRSGLTAFLNNKSYGCETSVMKGNP